MITLTRILPLLKKSLPFVLVAVAIGAAFYEGKNRGFAKGYEKAVREEIAKIEIPACPKCPEQKPCNGIDFDKIKGKYITLHNSQYLTVSGDTLLVQRFSDIVKQQLEQLKVVRVRK